MSSSSQKMRVWYAQFAGSAAAANTLSLLSRAN
jgi:hypothetical protein